MLLLSKINNIVKEFDNQEIKYKYKGIRILLMVSTGDETRRRNPRSHKQHWHPFNFSAGRDS